MLFRQIVLTRQWIADHQGLFLVQTETTRPNVFLNEPVITINTGLTQVKRNPPMVTRELSEYALRSGLAWFRVTSLKPVNPVNTPDDFEQESLNHFAGGQTEHWTIGQTKDGRVLRYAVTLRTEGSCLTCHSEHGYRADDIHGALSISIPITWAYSVIHDTNARILLYGRLSIMAAAAVMYLLFDRFAPARCSSFPPP